MDSKIFGVLIGLSSLALGCAADAPASESIGSDAEPSVLAESEEDPVVAVTFAALTVLECQSQATKCIQANTSGASNVAAACSAELTDCLADVRLQTPSNPTKGVTDTLDCANNGVTCISDPSGAVDCQRKVEQCVVDSVGKNTGLGVGAIARLLGVALDAVGTVVGAGVKVIDTTVGVAVDVVEPVVGVATAVVEPVVDAAGKVIKTTVNAAGQILDASGKVIGTVVNAGGKVVGTTINAAGEVIDATGKVIGKAAGVVGDVVGDVTGGVLGAAGGLLGGLGNAATCAAESQKCWRDSRDFSACQTKYRTCTRK